MENPKERGERKNCPEMASASKERISETDKVANFGLALLQAESADLGSQGSLGWLGSQGSRGRQDKILLSIKTDGTLEINSIFERKKRLAFGCKSL